MLFDDGASKSTSEQNSPRNNPFNDFGEEQKPFGHAGLVFVLVLSTPTLLLGISYILAQNLGPHAIGTGMIVLFVLALMPPIAIGASALQFVFTLCSFFKLRTSGAVLRWTIVAVNLITVVLLRPAIENLLRSLDKARF